MTDWSDHILLLLFATLAGTGALGVFTATDGIDGAILYKCDDPETPYTEFCSNLPDDSWPRLIFSVAVCFAGLILLVHRICVVWVEGRRE